MKHLGGGVCVFENAIDCDWDYAYEAFSQVVDMDSSNMYEESVNPETGEEVLVNRSGYLFPKNEFNKMPQRGSSIHQTNNERLKHILGQFEDAKDKCLLDYLLMFPLAYKNIWWKVKGHIVRYDATYTQFLGSHSDTSADYVYGYAHPRDQLATRNTLSCIVYLNDCVDAGETTDKHAFSGGAHHFDFLGITYLPKRGDILMFPSNFIASHEVKPVVDGIRLSYLGWYAHGSPNENYNESIVDPNQEPERASISTNVYMTSLRDDFAQHIISNGVDAHQNAWALVQTGF